MILVVEHEVETPAGRLGDALERRGIPHRIVRAWAQEPPRGRDADAFVLLGGTMGVGDVERYPFLLGELRLVDEATAAERPVLGICLGAQLVAEALGGRVRRADRPEVTVEPVELTDAGRSHDVLSAVEGVPLVRVHEDTFDPPADATVLALGGGFVQAFEAGSALALQPHPEAGAAILESWLGGLEEMLARAGADAEAVRRRARAADAEMARAADALFGRWAEAALGE
ncbi:MAG TPA: type 1 glutamine amidotransferase [Actinobacteria bacterium]|nr:type 1 glutamine amidotransferase [Actinomycetota bacterium]